MSFVRSHLLSRFLRIADRVVEVWRLEGPRGLLARARLRIRRRREFGAPLLGVRSVAGPQAAYSRWRRRHALGNEELQRLSAQTRDSPYRPRISLLMPAGDPPVSALERAIASVRAQVYPEWELCIADDGSATPAVREALESASRRDGRIRLTRPAPSGGISPAWNAALDLATGEFVGLLDDDDDELAPDALAEVVLALRRDPTLDFLYSDEDKIAPSGMHEEPVFKPSWSPTLMASMNYITHFAVLRRSVVLAVGGFRSEFDGSQGYDLFLRVTRRSDRVARIPEILYSSRKTQRPADSNALAQQHAHEAARRAIEEHCNARGTPASVTAISHGIYRVRYRIPEGAGVSVIVPTKDRPQLLRRCLGGLARRTSFRRFEVIVVDNGSRGMDPAPDPALPTGAIKVARAPGPFNFSMANNLGARHATGNYLLFLNDDTEPADPDWLTAMLEHAGRPEVGVVGAKLLYPNRTVQHSGMVLGMDGLVGHAYRGASAHDPGYFGQALVPRDVSAVTGACLMIRRDVFDEVGGWDPAFPLDYADVDLCLRVRQKGYLVVYTPFAVLYHREGATRGKRHSAEDETRFVERWGDAVRRGDPYYNPNLSRSSPGFILDA